MRVFCIFFFFKQKTAYEMRISDWSSDVCSSDLGVPEAQRFGLTDEDAGDARRHDVLHGFELLVLAARGQLGFQLVGLVEVIHDRIQIGRASCRERVGSTCRSRWSPYH